jgi:cbb3-type cytochrome c oxidase subunit III
VPSRPFSTLLRVPRSLLAAAAAVGIVLVAAACGTGGYSVGGDAGRGKELFTQKCGSCHTLADAATVGTIGPDLDDAFGPGRRQGIKERSIQQVVAGQIRYPGTDTSTGAPGMPADLVTGDDVDSVADYVAKVAGKPVEGGGGGEISATDGKEIFVAAGCGGCHVLGDAGSAGTVGPNLDEATPARALVVERVTNGRAAMPSFADKLDASQIDAVADYVASTAGR